MSYFSLKTVILFLLFYDFIFHDFFIVLTVLCSLFTVKYLILINQNRVSMSRQDFHLPKRKFHLLRVIGHP